MIAGIDLTTQALAKLADKSGEFGALTNLKSLFGPNGQPLMNFNSLTSAQKGVVGEVLGGATSERIAPEAERIGRIPAVGEQGIDDLYKVSKPGVDYVIVEYKFGTSALKKTADGLQMSDDWLSGVKTTFDRISQAVNDDRSLAVNVQEALDSGRVEKWLVHTDPYGNVTVGVLDKDGKFIPNPGSKIIGQEK